MKRNNIIFLLLCIIAHPLAYAYQYTATHNAHFKVMKYKGAKLGEKGHFVITMQFIDEHASISAPKRDVNIPFYNKKTKTIECDSTKSEYDEHSMLFAYIKEEIIDHIHNETGENVGQKTPQIDIIVDLYDHKNDFTRPYKDLYREIKQFYEKRGFTVHEPPFKLENLYASWGTFFTNLKRYATQKLWYWG